MNNKRERQRRLHNEAALEALGTFAKLVWFGVGLNVAELVVHGRLGADGLIWDKLIFDSIADNRWKVGGILLCRVVVWAIESGLDRGGGGGERLWVGERLVETRVIDVLNADHCGWRDSTAGGRIVHVNNGDGWGRYRVGRLQWRGHVVVVAIGRLTQRARCVLRVGACRDERRGHGEVGRECRLVDRVHRVVECDRGHRRRWRIRVARVHSRWAVVVYKHTRYRTRIRRIRIIGTVCFKIILFEIKKYLLYKI